MTLLGHGAEAKIEQDGEIVQKIRYPKTYRHPQLDQQLRITRTAREKKSLLKAKELGVRVPNIFENKDKTTLSLETIHGKKLRDVLLEDPTQKVYLKQAGEWLATLHDNDLIHGDLTTSNMLVDNNGLVLIDFGLSQISKKIEDRAVDLHVLEETLESTHPNNHEEFFKAFLEGYATSKNYDAVLDRLNEVRLRGRNKTQ